MTRLQKEVESCLSQLKKELLPLANIFDLVEIANTSTTFNIPLQKLYDESVFQLSSSLRPPGYEEDYTVESSSWYKDYINVEETIDFVSGFFGDREVTRYYFDLMEAKSTIEQHLQYSLEGVHTTIRLNFLNVYDDYKKIILSEVEKVINCWLKVIESHTQSRNQEEVDLQNKVTVVNQQLFELNELRKTILAM